MRGRTISSVFFLFAFGVVFRFGVEGVEIQEPAADWGGSSEYDPAVFIGQQPAKPRPKRTFPAAKPPARVITPTSFKRSPKPGPFNTRTTSAIPKTSSPHPETTPPSSKPSASPKASLHKTLLPEPSESPTPFASPFIAKAHETRDEWVSNRIGPREEKRALRPQDFELTRQNAKAFEILDRHEQEDPFFLWYFTGAPKAITMGHFMKDMMKTKGGDIEDFGITRIENPAICRDYHDHLLGVLYASLHSAHDSTMEFFRSTK